MATTATSNTAIVAAQGALSADTRIRSPTANRWIEVKGVWTRCARDSTGEVTACSSRHRTRSRRRCRVRRPDQGRRVMSTSLSGPAAWQSEGIDPALVAKLHRSVGEALTAAHVAHEEANRARLSASDERALARKLVADDGVDSDGRPQRPSATCATPTPRCASPAASYQGRRRTPRSSHPAFTMLPGMSAEAGAVRRPKGACPTD